ncbi:MAG: hypothetical protein AMXMBFR34_39050 [Myxococcaceae bacterium]
MPPAPSKPPAPSPAAEKKQPRFPIPWGLFIVLGVYGLAVLAYVKFQYWDSPQYQAAQKYARALYLLGVDDGRKCSEAQLVEAMELVLEAARLVPDEIELAKHSERLRFRFEERKFKIPKDLERHAELVSATAQRREREKDPWLVVGVRDRGWGPEQLLGGPRRAVFWSIPGGVIIILIWTYGRFSARAVREKEHEDDLKKSEAEVRALGKFREGLKQAPSRYEAPEDDEDEGGDTLADPPKPRPSPKRVPTGSGAKAVARPASSPGRPGESRPASSNGRPAVKKRPPEE